MNIFDTAALTRAFAPFLTLSSAIFEAQTALAKQSLELATSNLTQVVTAKSPAEAHASATAASAKVTELMTEHVSSMVKLNGEVTRHQYAGLVKAGVLPNSILGSRDVAKSIDKAQKQVLDTLSNLQIAAKESGAWTMLAFAPLAMPRA